MELQSSKDNENVKVLEASVVEKNKEDEGREVAADTGKNKNEVTEISVGGMKEIQKFGEAFMDEKQEEKASETLVEENRMASQEAESSSKRTPRVTSAKTKTVKKPAKKLVKRKSAAGTPVKDADVTKQQGISDDADQDLTAAVNEKDEKAAEASFGGNGLELKKVREGAGDERDAEPSLCGNVMDGVKVTESSAEDGKVAEAESSEKKSSKVLKEETEIVKTHLKRLQKGKNIKGTPPAQGVHKEGETMLHGTKEGINLDMVVTDNKVDKEDAKGSPGGDEKKFEKVMEGSIGAPAHTKSARKKLIKRLKAKDKIGRTPATQIVKKKIDNGTPQVQENDQRGGEQCNNVEELNSLDVNTSEGGPQKSIIGKNKLPKPTQDNTNFTEDVKKRKGKWVLGMNKKPKNEPVSADAGQQGIEESPAAAEKEGTSGNRKAKCGGLIFMCNAKTKPDCFRFGVMGVSEKKKDSVMGIKPGLKLFLYDYDLKLLYGIFVASSVGGLKLERKAFGGSFPVQVRFKVLKDCKPLPESILRKAIKENYNNKNKFKTELTPKQVNKLRKLFRPAAVPATAQLIHPQPIPVDFDADRIRSDKDHRSAAGSHRTHTSHRHEGGHESRGSPPHDLYLTEREYRTYGLRRGQTSQQHYPIPRGDLYRAALDSHHPDLDSDRLLRHTDIERHNHREPHYSEPLYLPRREYYPHDHGPQNPINPPRPAVALESYTRDPYYSYEYRPPVAYPDDALYLRYATADSLAEYYRTRRYPALSHPSSVTSRYPYTGPPSFPYR